MMQRLWGQRFGFLYHHLVLSELVRVDGEALKVLHAFLQQRSTINWIKTIKHNLAFEGCVYSAT